MNTDDNELLVRIAEGDVRSFELLYERFGALVYSTALHTLADTQAAEDVTQEIFVLLWRRPDHFDPARGRFVTWLLSVTRNRAVDELRSRGRRRRLATDPPEAAENSPDPDAQDNPENAALASDDRAAVREALSGLPHEQRLALEMAYFGGMTQSEIADALGQPLGTVKTRIRLGMQKMRVALLAQGRALSR
jgi:RNA polymerase sigma-70 factor (ECF subfamily)